MPQNRIKEFLFDLFRKLVLSLHPAKEFRINRPSQKSAESRGKTMNEGRDGEYGDHSEGRVRPDHYKIAMSDVEQSQRSLDLVQPERVKRVEPSWDERGKQYLH